MENKISVADFLKKKWLWHFFITTGFLVLALAYFNKFSTLKSENTEVVVAIAGLVLAITHSWILAILSIRWFSRSQPKPGLIYLLHFFGSAALSYFLFIVVGMGLAVLLL